MSTSHTQESNSRYEELEIRRRYHELSEWGLDAQVEAVAHHYLSLTGHAKDMLEILYAKRRGADRESSNQILAHMLEMVRRNHAHDLGIRLSWIPEIRDYRELGDMGITSAHSPSSQPGHEP